MTTKQPSPLVLLSGQTDPFTPRETEIALLVAQGLRNKQIGDQLRINENTVKVHLKAIFRKAGVTRRGRLAVLILQGQGQQ